MWSVRFSARRVAIPGGGTTSRPDVHAPPALVSAPRGCGSLSQGAKRRASQTELGFECGSPSGEVRLVLSSITLKVQKFNTMDVCVSSCNSPAWPAGQEGRGLKVAADGHSRTTRACFLRPCWALASGRGGRGRAGGGETSATTGLRATSSAWKGYVSVVESAQVYLKPRKHPGMGDPGGCAGGVRGTSVRPRGREVVTALPGNVFTPVSFILNEVSSVLSF